MYGNGGNVLSCKTSVTPSMEWVLPPGEHIMASMSLQSFIIAETVSFGKPYVRSICSIFPLYMESNANEKSANQSIA